MAFNQFKASVTKQFKEMSKHRLFRTRIDKDQLWATYLSSFPEGTNPVFRQRTEHDCACCRQFIRAIGNAVAIIDDRLVSIWDGVCGDPTYDTVAKALSEMVKAGDIENIFLHTENSIGTDRNREMTDNGILTWDHFHVELPQANRRDRQLVCRGVDMGLQYSRSLSGHDVFLRGLNEITTDALQTVLDLIAENNLYRGEEHRFAVQEFLKVKNKFSVLSEKSRDYHVWLAIGDHTPESVTHFRNTAIGQLVTNLSLGMGLEVAVGKFEAMVAGSNYKRSTALVTEKMRDQARATINELGLMSALSRRYAHLDDISVNDILFANRDARKALKGVDPFDIPVKPALPKNNNAEAMKIETFIKDILPNVSTVELFVDNTFTNNFASLIAPVEKNAGRLFKWNNDFSWTYTGDVADSIKERVKSAGGNVSGDLCCRLAWSNYDDLDFHLILPTREEIYFNHRRSLSGGQLDVDMNAGSGQTRNPVENIFFPDRRTMPVGKYHLYVHQFCARETRDVGFEVEIDFLGTTYSFSYEKALRTNEKVSVAEMQYTAKGELQIIKSLPSTSRSRSMWNVDTQQFHQVNVLMYSPNYWVDGEGSGNKHYFFMLDGCKNDGSARGFYNEFLRSDLDQHRKALEMVGSKMRTDQDDHQLSGLGFSSTIKKELTVRVTGNINRTLKVSI